ncbi:MAG: hypothetical protein QM493_10400 [Sulfurovum sp.]
MNKLKDKNILVYSVQQNFNEETPMQLNYEDDPSKGESITLVQLYRAGYKFIQAHKCCPNKTLIIVMKE